jgi:predicted dehydrogenase
MAGNGHPATYVQGNGKPLHPVTADSRSSPFASARGHLRFAIIGCGEIAVANAEAIALAPNATLAACHDVNPALAEDLAQRHGAVTAPSIEAVLERADVDAVMLCLPHHLHAPIAIQAAEAGKHVVVEKPMAIDLESAIRMVRASERSGVVMSVCFPERYEAAVKIIGRWLSDHAIGELGGLDVRWFADKPASYFHSGLTGRSPSGWRRRLEQAGGGVLLMNLVHDVDLVRHLTGARVEEVMAFSGNLERAAEVEDSIGVSVRYEGGPSARSSGARHQEGCERRACGSGEPTGRSR